MNQYAVVVKKSYKDLTEEYSFSSFEDFMKWEEQRVSVGIEEKGDDDNGWIEHDGSRECPVPSGSLCEVMFRDGSTTTDNTPEDWDWIGDGNRRDIIRYRLVK